MQPREQLKHLRFADHTLIMGILNVTEDSFSDGGRYITRENARTHGRDLINAGADILDIGAESSRPTAQRVPQDVEKERIVRTLADLADFAHERGVAISVDTTRASVAQAALENGADIINDVSGGCEDPDMFPLIAHNPCLYILQHWRGRMPLGSTVYPHGTTVDVISELKERVKQARAAGVAEEQIILDPGLGFNKPGPVPNFDLLAHLDAMTQLPFPILIGASRKRFLSMTIGPDAATSKTGGDQMQLRLDEATAVISALSALQGVWAVRVHNVACTRDALRVANGYITARNNHPGRE